MPASKDEVNQRFNVVWVIGGPKRRVRHVATRDVDHLLVLNVEARRWIVLQGTDMVEMCVREDHVGFAGGIDSEFRQRFAWPADEVVFAAHPLRLA